MRRLAFSTVTLAILTLVAAAGDVQKDGTTAAVVQDPNLTCLGTGDLKVCCYNCTSCCKDYNNCNLGANNRGWGNIGNDNIGDFNMANRARGDCNKEDGGFGIGGPSFDGCPEETWAHIIKFCAINPYYHKCANPPVYYHDDLAEILGTTIHACDGGIAVQKREGRGSQLHRKRKKVIAIPRPKLDGR